MHRRIAELPNVMSAEELNVAFPVTFWTTSSDKAPDLEPSTRVLRGLHLLALAKMLVTILYGSMIGK